MPDKAGESRTLLLESCLPLPLQDLCLLEVINDLDSFPEDLLASLPRWLRYRLLNNLPVLDLCRLERSAVAAEVDLGELWASRWKNPRIPHPHYQQPLSNTIRSDFHYRIKDAGCLQHLEPELLAAFQQLSVNKDKIDAKQKYLLQVASDVLDSTEFDTDERALTIVPADWLISMKGDRLLQDLTEAKHNPHQARSNITYINTSSASYRKAQDQSNACVEAYKTIWESQTTSLARYEQDDVRLAPHRLLPIRERGNPLELLSLLVNDCCLEPLSISHLGLSRMTNSKEWSECTKEREKFLKILKHVLQRVTILGVQCDLVGQLESVMCTVLEAVLADGEKSKLQYIFSQRVTREFMLSLSPHFYSIPESDACTAPQTLCYQGLRVIQVGITDLEPTAHISSLLEQQPQLKCVQLDFNCGAGEVKARSDLIQLFSTLSTLFSRPQFLFLKLAMKPACSIASSLLQDLLCGFMRAPCKTVKQLTITSESSDPAIFSHEEIDLASVAVNLGGASTSTEVTVPDCGLQHKKLMLTANLQNIVGNLLRLSTVRVNSIYFDCSDDGYPYLHQASLHPDLQVMSISIRFQFCPFDQLLKTVENDLMAFIKKPTLNEIALYGYWNMYDEIRAALVKALHQRAEIGAIHKLMLTTTPITSTTRMFSSKEFEELWKGIFSLPQLNEMEIVIAGGICNQILNNEESIYAIWNEVAMPVKLKMLKVVKYSGEDRSDNHKMLQELTHSLLFTNKPY